MTRGVKCKLSLEELKSMYINGMSMNKMVKQFKIDPRRLSVGLRELGVDTDIVKRRKIYPKQIPPLNSGDKASNWKGGRIKNYQGYVLLKQNNHHRTQSKGYVLEHIVVWENANGRILPDGWVIHHLNGIKSDNRPENLFAVKAGSHHRLVEPYKKRIKQLEEEILKLKQGGLF